MQPGSFGELQPGFALLQIERIPICLLHMRPRGLLRGCSAHELMGEGYGLARSEILSRQKGQVLSFHCTKRVLNHFDFLPIWDPWQSQTFPSLISLAVASHVDRPLRHVVRLQVIWLMLPLLAAGCEVLED